LALQHYIRPPTRHVGGDGDGSEGAGLGNDAGFVGVVFGVEDAARYSGPVEGGGEAFGFDDGQGADEDGTAGFVYG
jgi:hypothetical protein